MFRLKLLGAAGLAASLVALPALAATNDAAGAGGGANPTAGASAPANNGGANKDVTTAPTTGTNTAAANTAGTDATATGNTATGTNAAPPAKSDLGASPAAPASTAPGNAAANTNPGATNEPAAGTNAAANETGGCQVTSAGHEDYQKSGVGVGDYTGTENFIRKTGSNNNAGNNASNKDNNWRPSQRNPLLADNCDARLSKVIGTNVYNEYGAKLGSVDDILQGSNGLWAVISTNQKKVAVKFDQLRFGDANANGDNKLVLPNAIDAQLNTAWEFHYNVTNYQNVANTNNR